MSDVELPKLDNEEQSLVDAAALAWDIRDTAKKETFKLLFGAAHDRAIKARNALVTVDPENSKEIRRLQNEVKRYEEMAEWIRIAVTSGDNAQQMLDTIRGAESSGEPAAEQD